MIRPVLLSLVPTYNYTPISQISPPFQIPVMAKPLFIVFEGLDACGKSTLSTKFAQQHQLRLIKAVPKELKSWLPKIANTELPEATFSFFTLCNFMRAIEINQALKEGESIIMDRYFYTSYAYHKELLGGDLPRSILELYGIQDLPHPDMVVFLDVPKAVRSARISKCGGEMNWYGDEVSMKTDLTDIYFELFKAMKVNVLEVDNHKNSVEGSMKIINKEYDQLIARSEEGSKSVLSA